MTSTISGVSWILTNVYAPCSPEERNNFLSWLNVVNMPDDTEWLIVVDFNLFRKQSDRNKPGGNV
jgi:hypothetical protein